MAEVTIQQAFELVLRHRKAGRTAEAESLYRHIIEQIPKEPNALHTLGILAHQAGQHEFAADLFRKAAELSPDDSEFHDHFGMAQAAQGRWSEAAISLARAMELGPTAETCLNLAHALRRTGRTDEAMDRYQQAIELQPNLHAAHNNLGNILREKRRFDEAIASYRRAIEIKPDYLEAHNNLGSALLDSGRPDEAIEQFARALAMRPDLPELYNNLGKAHRAKNEVAAAISSYDRALALRADEASAHWNRSLMLLLSGRFEEGWPEYEWRWRVPEFESPRRNFRQRLWSGQPLNGRRILLHAEQGFGDAIHFARYVPLVARQGGRVILECPPELYRLFQTLPGVEQLIVVGQAIPEFDVHSPLLSLPLAFGTTQQTIPSFIPYLQADPTRIAAWKQRLELPIDRLRVGLIWAGNPGNLNDRNRSIPFEMLSPLAECPNVAFYNLQTGAAAREAAATNSAPTLMNPAAQFVDFADSAAMIANLDLVIAVDTAGAHLAGAIGAPTWLLLPFAPDWRWQLDREDTPWYPTMRLFRQPRIGDWQTVIRQVAADLSHVAGAVLNPVAV